MARPANKVHGLFTAIITPFDALGKADPRVMVDLADFQVSKGTEGIYVCGSTGLAPLLSVQERESMAEAAVRGAGGRVPVVVQVGAADTATTVELAKHAEKAGAYAVASLTPYYYKAGEASIARHLESVSEAVSLPVFAYNIPQFTGNNMLPSLVGRLAKQGAISGVKDSSRDILQFLDLLEAVPEDFVVMNGTEEYGLFAIMSGANGLVSGGASALPELFKSLVASQRAGDYEAAEAAQQTIQAVKDLVKSGPISAYYAVLKHRGVDCGVPRAPILPLSEDEYERVIAGLHNLKLV